MIILTSQNELHYANGCFIDEGTYNEIAELQAENERLQAELTFRNQTIAMLQKDKRKAEVLQAEKKVLVKTLKHLVLLHECEQEGIRSGMPTIKQWEDAVSRAIDVLVKEK